jgi:hypothetical protein
VLSVLGTDPRTWRADTIDGRLSWRRVLSESSLNVLEQFDRERQVASQPLTDLAVPAWLAAACAADLAPVRDVLEAGRGFAIIAAGQPGRYSPERLRTIYWLIGGMLGRPIEQNVQGDLLYDVRDTGQDVRYGARFSITNAESTFHTDNSFGDDIVDIIGLLCLQAAKSGGASQIVSARTVANEMRAEHPNALAVLRGQFHFDRRGGLRPGDEPTARFPVLSGEGADLVVRYLRYWIEAGHEKIGLPLTDEQANALNVFDRTAGAEQLRVEFTMQPGEMLFMNNRWLLHNRTAFADHPEPERQRHYLRLWLRSPA